MSASGGRLAAWVVRRRGPIAAVWLLAAVVLLPRGASAWGAAMPRSLILGVPEDVRRMFVSRDGRATLLEIIPALVFCIVFGLSMDYEVFLVARVREARRAGFDERAAIAEGLAHTGRLITSAAAIMVVVFGAFMLGAFLLTKMLGFALAVAVLLDATVMRLAISPALLALAGRWNWWPGERV